MTSLTMPAAVLAMCIPTFTKPANRSAFVKQLWIFSPKPLIRPAFPLLGPLQLALSALRDKFFVILQANGFSPSDVQGASLRFQFPLLGADGYACQVTARLESSRGYQYMAVVG